MIERERDITAYGYRGAELGIFVSRSRLQTDDGFGNNGWDDWYRLDRSDGNDYAFRHASYDPTSFLTGRPSRSSIGIEKVVKVP